MRQAGHVVSMGDRRLNIGFWWVNLKEKDHLGDPGVDVRMFRKCDVGGLGLDRSGSG
jgi:hypothetical protein